MVIILTKLSLKCNLILILQKTINLYQEQLELSCRYEKKLEVWENIEVIPMSQTRDPGGIVYKSAIALKLAPVWQQPAIDIATKLVSYCREIANAQTNQKILNFQLEVISSGMIYIKLTDLSIAQWLDNLTCVPFNFDQENLQGDVEYKTPKTTDLFPIQYSHARCCSLLRMSESERLITLSAVNPETHNQSCFIKTPNPIPWRQTNGQLQFLHQSEYQLISQIASTLDRIYCVSSIRKPINWEKVAAPLSAAFQIFYRHCRIWGEVKLETPKLAQARLGLVFATQTLLRFLLEERLSGKAPVEL